MKALITNIAALLLLTACNGGGGSNNNIDNPLARTNMVGHWNHVAIDATGYDHTSQGVKEQAGPTRSSRAMAIVHIAMSDAVQSIQKRYQTYTDIADVSTNASLDTAVAQSAHDSLVSLFPSQKQTFDNELENDLSKVADGEAKTLGLAAGQNAAAAILANRANDGSDSATQSQSYTFSQEPGKWRKDPFNPNQNTHGANWSKVRPFVMHSASQFRAPTPPAINSAAYAEAYAEAYRLGGDGVATPTERTEDQTNIGIYWAYDGTPSLCAPPRLYNQIAMQLAYDKGISDLGDLARLLALVNVSMADAGIASWETKFFYNYWRPVTGIRESDVGTGPTGKGDGNAQTPGDIDYTPLGAPASNLAGNNFTPPFPAYVSGHATFGGALFQTLRNYFGSDNIAFTFTSDELNGQTTDNQGNSRDLLPRSFSSFTQAEEENGQSRIYLGIHWSFDKTEGTKMGNKVANLVNASILKPR